MIAKGNLHGDGGALARYLMTGKKGEIAELLQCSIGTSKSQLNKAKMKMRGLLFPQRRILR